MVVPTEPLYMALNSVKKLRTSMGDLHKLLSNGIRAEHAEGNEAKFAQEIQDHINRINRFYRYVSASFFKFFLETCENSDAFTNDFKIKHTNFEYEAIINI